MPYRVRDVHQMTSPRVPCFSSRAVMRAMVTVRVAAGAVTVALLLLSSTARAGSTAHASIWAAMQAEPRLSAFTHMVEACEPLRALLQDSTAEVGSSHELRMPHVEIHMGLVAGKILCLTISSSAGNAHAQVTVFAPTNAALELLAVAHPQLAADVASNEETAAAFAAYHGAACAAHVHRTSPCHHRASCQVLSTHSTCSSQLAATYTGRESF